MKKTTAQIDKGSPLFKELEDKATKLDCVLHDHSSKRESLLDRHVDDFKNDLKIVSDKAIDDATEEILNPFF